MTIELVLIRHAETALSGTFCGHSDPPLNAPGLAQAHALSETLQHEPFDALYSSDLQRALATAEILGRGHSLSPIPSAALREINFGAWEGLSWTEIEKHDPAVAAQWIAEFPNLPSPEGEAFSCFSRRVLTEMHRLTAAGPERIAVASHAGVLRVVLQAMLAISAEQAWHWSLPFCSVLRLRRASVDAPWSLL